MKVLCMTRYIKVKHVTTLYLVSVLPIQHKKILRSHHSEQDAGGPDWPLHFCDMSHLVRGENTKVYTFHELYLWIMNTLGPKAYVWQRAWIWGKLQINGKLWWSLRGQLSQEWSSERRLDTVIICLGRTVLEPVTSWKLEGEEYVLTSGSMIGLFFQAFELIT